jgi:hypothetical protein
MSASAEGELECWYDENRVMLWEIALGVIDMDWSIVLSYEEYQAMPCKDDAQIARDIHRTRAPNEADALAVGRVLHAWSLVPFGSGYVQGHGFMVVLLLHVTGGDEARAWKMLVTLLAHPVHGLQVLSSDEMRPLVTQCAYTDVLVTARLPALSSHLCRHGISSLAWTTPFYLTLGTHCLSRDACLEVWDALLLGKWCPLSSSVGAVPIESRLVQAITSLLLTCLQHEQAALQRLGLMEHVYHHLQACTVLEHVKTRRHVLRQVQEGW